MSGRKGMQWFMRERGKRKESVMGALKNIWSGKRLDVKSVDKSLDRKFGKEKRQNPFRCYPNIHEKP